MKSETPHGERIDEIIGLRADICLDNYLRHNLKNLIKIFVLNLFKCINIFEMSATNKGRATVKVLIDFLTFLEINLQSLNHFEIKNSDFSELLKIYSESFAK